MYPCELGNNEELKSVDKVEIIEVNEARKRGKPKKVLWSIVFSDTQEEGVRGTRNGDPLKNMMMGN